MFHLPRLVVCQGQARPLRYFPARLRHRAARHPDEHDEKDDQTHRRVVGGAGHVIEYVLEHQRPPLLPGVGWVAAAGTVATGVGFLKSVPTRCRYAISAITSRSFTFLRAGSFPCAARLSAMDAACALA